MTEATRLDWLRVMRDEKHMQMVYNPTYELKAELKRIVAEIEKLEGMGH